MNFECAFFLYLIVAFVCFFANIYGFDIFKYVIL